MLPVHRDAGDAADDDADCDEHESGGKQGPLIKARRLRTDRRIRHGCGLVDEITRHWSERRRMNARRWNAYERRRRRQRRIPRCNQRLGRKRSVRRGRRELGHHRSERRRDRGFGAGSGRRRRRRCRHRRGAQKRIVLRGRKNRIEDARGGIFLECTHRQILAILGAE